MADKHDGRLNLSIPQDVKHWFAVACQLRNQKMTAAVVEWMRGYCSLVLTEHGLPDPFAAGPTPKKAKPKPHKR